MPTLAHRSIRHCLQMIGPFSPTSALPKEGQQQCYAFFTGLYQKMLESPEASFVFPAPYEAYMRSPKRPLPGKEKAHAADSRESTLRNVIQQAITFYALFFWEVGLRSSLDGDRLRLSAEAWQQVLMRMGRLHGAKHHPNRLEKMKAEGLSITETEGSVTLFHPRFPLMMPALFYLCTAPENKFKFFNYLRLDFQSAGGSPSVDTICRTLPDASVHIIRTLEESFSALNAKARVKPLRSITSDFQWKVEYHKAGKNLAGFYADGDRFLLCLYFNDHKNISALAEELLQEASPLFSWFCAQFPERLCQCPSNRRVKLGNEYRRICGLSNRAEILNPTETDLQNALTILKRFRKL